MKNKTILFWLLQIIGWGLKIELNNGLEVETSRRQALKFRQHLEF